VTELRDYQHTAIRDLRRSISSGHRSPVLVAPTGSGKTAIAGEMIRSAREKCYQVLFLAPRRELVYQVQGRLGSLGLEYGTIMAGEDPSLMPGIQVASIDTLHARAVRRDKIPLPRAGLVIVDESHIFGEKAASIIRHYQDSGSIVVGLTATPAKASGVGLGMLYDDMVMGPSVSDLTSMGYLVPARYFSGTAPDMDGVQIRAGDWAVEETAQRAGEPELIGQVIDNWKRIAGDKQTFVYAVNVAHSKHLAEAFERAGVSVEQLDGDTEHEIRRGIMSRLWEGITQVVVNVDVYTYGVDYPPVECIVLARPTKSITRYLQAVGRGLRTYEGKDSLMVLDHGRCIETCGFADDEQPWSLSGKEKIQERKAEKKTPEPIECYQCGETFRPAPECPSCGADMHKKSKKAIREHEAELEEIERRNTKKAGREWSQDDKGQFLSELLGYAQSKGYKRGWAVHAYQERLGVLPWPVWPQAPKEPGEDTRRWIQHRNIRNAKRREKENATA